MSTTVKLIGIGPRQWKENALPVYQLISEVHELGFGNLWTDLENFNESVHGILTAVDHPEPGRRQIWVHDTESFLANVRQNPQYWDSTGMGWNEAMVEMHEDLENGHLISWWFIAES